MEKTLFVSIFITILFAGVKFIEMKFIEKELKPLKFLVRDSIVVFIVSFIGIFMCFQFDETISQFFDIVTDNKTLNIANTEIFTDLPGF
jgi:hypothetical protein